MIEQLIVKAGFSSCILIEREDSFQKLASFYQNQNFLKLSKSCDRNAVAMVTLLYGRGPSQDFVIPRSCVLEKTFTKLSFI